MADEQIVTSIVAKADLSNLVSEVHRVTASLQTLQRELLASNKSIAAATKVANNAFRDTLVQSGLYSSHFVNLHSDIDKFGKNLDAGRLKLKDYFNTFQQHSKTTKGLIRELAKEQVMLQNAILQPLGRNAQGLMQFNVAVPRGLDLVKNKTQLARMEMQIMNRALSEGATSLINWGKNTQWAGRQLTVGLTVPLTMFGTQAAKAFREADQELTRLAKVYGGLAATSSADLAQVRKDVSATAKELSASMGVSFKDTIALAADIAATGKTGNELLGSIRETTRLAVLGEVDRQDAMKATLAIQSAFKQNTEELANSINFLNAVENQTSTTLNDLVEAIPKAGPIIKGLGGSVQDLALYLTAMREGGISASEGANALKSGLASLINPTKVAQARFKDFGIDILGIVNQNAGNVTATLLALQSALDQLNPLQKQQALEQLFGKFQFARMNALFENLGKQGSQTLQVLDLMKASTSELANVAGRELTAVTESASGKFKRAMESFKASLSGAGEQFLNFGTKLLNVLTKVMDFFNNLPGPIKKFLALFGGFTAIAGPLIMITGVLANFFGYITKGIVLMRQFFMGQKGWKLLTPEMIAAQKAAEMVEKSFYSDAQAAEVLHTALTKLVNDYNNLNVAMMKGGIPVPQNPGVTTTGGSPIIIPGTQAAMSQLRREVDPNNPYSGEPNTRAISHINPRDINNPASFLGGVPGAIPVNQKIGRNPQIYMTERLPNIEGLTSFGGVSSGIVAGEAARYHALLATLGMQTEAEIAALKKTIALGGTIGADLLSTFDDILPITMRLSENAARDAAGIVANLRAGNLTVDQARAEIIALNARLEASMQAELSAFAGSRGRVIDFTKAPLMDQPVTDANAQFTLRDLYKKENNRAVMQEFGRLRGVRTFGAPYSIHTTRLPKFNIGGPIKSANKTYGDTSKIEDFGPNKTTVSGSTSINYDDRLGNIPVGGYVLSQGPSMDPDNSAITNPNVVASTYSSGSSKNITAALTPGEIVYGPGIMKDPVLYSAVHAANNGYNFGGQIMDRMRNYGTPAPVLSADKTAQLYDYLDYLTGEGYSDSFRENAILNDATALIDSGKYSDIDRAVEAAIRDVDNALRVADGDEQKYYQARQIQAERKKLNTGVIGKRQNVTSMTRDLVAEKLRLLGFKHVYDYADRAHLFPISYAETNRGYYGQAIHDPWNKYSRWLSDRLGIQDRVPLPGASADFRANLIARELGFDDHYDMLLKRAEFERTITTGRMMRGRTPTLALMRFLGRGKNYGGFIPGYNGGGGPQFVGMPIKYSRIAAARLIAERVSQEVRTSRFRNLPITQTGHKVEDLGGFSVGDLSRVTNGVYRKPDGRLVVYKAVESEAAALAEMRSAALMRGPHKLKTSQQQTIKVIADPTDPSGKRKILVIESAYDKNIANPTGEFTPVEGIRQLLAATARGDKDVKISNVSGSYVADQGNAGVFPTASNRLTYGSPLTSAEEHLLMLLGGIKGGASGDLRRAIREDAKKLGYKKWSSKFKKELEDSILGYKETIPTFKLNSEEVGLYANMQHRLESLRKADLENIYETLISDSKTRKKPVQKREMGGSVSKDQPYLVGEKGPELFVPGMSGAIVPKYVSGGPITSFRNTYGERWNPETKTWEPKSGSSSSSTPIVLDAEKGAGGLENRSRQMDAESRMSKSMNRMNAGFGLQIAGSMIGGNFGNALMIGGAVAQLSSILDKAKAGGFLKTITSMSAMMNKLKMAFIATSKFAKDFIKIVSQAFTKSNPIGWIVTAVIAFTTLALKLKKYNEERGKAARLEFGGTKESYASVGIKDYKSLTDRLKDYNAQLELNKVKIRSAFESYTKTGPTGITLTIKELNEAVKNAKENQKDYVNALNILKSDEVVSYVANLKAQFVALGMSSSEAANQIYAIVKASKYANQAFAAVTSESFREIVDQRTALERLVKNLSSNTGGTFNAEKFDIGISTLVNGAMNYMNYLITAKETSKEITDQYDALAKVLDEVSKIQGSTNTLTNDQLNELKKTNIMYANILGTMENTQSILAKIILYQSGLAEVVNLAMMGAEESVIFAKNLKVVEDTINTVFEGDAGIADPNNPLAALAKQLKLRKDAATAAKQIIDAANEFDKEAIQDQIDRQRDLIDAIEKEREARLKVLEVQEKSANFEIDIKSAQIKYQQYLAAGDMAQAAQAQLEIQKLSQNRQSDLAKQAINDKADRDRQKAEDEINRLQKIIDDQEKALSTAQKTAKKEGESAATLEDYVNTIENIARNARTPEGNARKLTQTEYETVMNTIESMKKSKDSKIVDYAKSLETKYASNLDVQGGAVKTPTFSPQKYIDSVVSYLNQKGGEANKDFSNAVKEFSLAVDKFGGVPSQGFAKPEKGQYYNNPIGFDYTYLKFSNKDGTKKIAIQTSSIEYEKVYRDAIAKGWRYEGPQAGTGFMGNKAPEGYTAWSSVLPVPKLALGGQVQHFGPGGNVSGPGTETSDSIPAMLSDGEYVINAASAKIIGYDNLDSLNAIRRATGGAVFKNGSLYAAQGVSSLKVPQNQNSMTWTLKQKQDYIVSLLMNRGISYNGAVGVLANLMAESGLTTTAWNKSENSYGIAQWRLGRLDRLKKFARDNNSNINSLQIQAEFLWRELQERQYADLLGLLKYKNITPLKATELFMTIFERPYIKPGGATTKALGRLALVKGYDLKNSSSSPAQPLSTSTTKDPQGLKNPSIPTDNPFLAPNGKQEINPFLNIYKISGISRLNALKLAKGGFARKYKGGTPGGVKSGYDASVDYFRALGDLAVNFETDKSFLAPDQINELKSIAEQIKKTGVKTLLVNGYADQRGSKSYNMALSMRRARHVAALLSAFAPGINFIPNAKGEQGSSYSKTAMSKKRRVAIELPYQGGGLSLPAEPRNLLGSVPFEGLFGGGLGFGGMLTMHKGGPVGHKHNIFERVLSPVGQAFNSMIEGWKSFGTAQSFKNSGISYKPKSISNYDAAAVTQDTLAEIYGINPAKRVMSGTSHPVFGSKALGTSLDVLGVVGNAAMGVSAARSVAKYASSYSPSAQTAKRIAQNRANFEKLKSEGKVGSPEFEQSRLELALRESLYYSSKNKFTPVMDLRFANYKKLLQENRALKDFEEPFETPIANGRFKFKFTKENLPEEPNENILNYLNAINENKGVSEYVSSQGHKISIIDTAGDSSKEVAFITFDPISGHIHLRSVLDPYQKAAYGIHFGEAMYNKASEIARIRHSGTFSDAGRASAPRIGGFMKYDPVYDYAGSVEKYLKLIQGKKITIKNEDLPPERTRVSLARRLSDPPSEITIPEVPITQRVPIAADSNPTLMGWDRPGAEEFGRIYGRQPTNEELADFNRATKPDDWGSPRRNSGWAKGGRIQKFAKGGKPKPFEWTSYKGKNSFLKDMDTSFLGGFRGAWNFLGQPIANSISRMTFGKPKNYKWNDALYDSATVGSLGLSTKLRSIAKAGSPLAIAAYEKAVARQGVQLVDRRFGKRISDLMEMGIIPTSNKKKTRDALLTEYHKLAQGTLDLPEFAKGGIENVVNMWYPRQLAFANQRANRGWRGDSLLQNIVKATKGFIKKDDTAFWSPTYRGGTANISSEDAPRTLIHELGHRNLDLELGGPKGIMPNLFSPKTYNPIHEAYASAFELYAHNAGQIVPGTKYLKRIKNPFEDGAFYSHSGNDSTDLAGRFWEHLFGTAPGVGRRFYQHGTEWLIPYANTIKKFAGSQSDESVKNIQDLAKLSHALLKDSPTNRMFSSTLSPYSQKYIRDMLKKRILFKKPEWLIKATLENANKADKSFQVFRQLLSDPDMKKTIFENMSPEEVIKLITNSSLMSKFKYGGMVRKYHDWNGPIPGAYGKEVGAVLQAGREGVYDTDYINALRNGTINKSTNNSSVLNVGSVQMTFTEPVQNGRQVFEEFKALMNFEKSKSSSSISLGLGA